MGYVRFGAAAQHEAGPKNRCRPAAAEQRISDVLQYKFSMDLSEQSIVCR
jgi:hypothetical protein